MNGQAIEDSRPVYCWTIKPDCLDPAGYCSTHLWKNTVASSPPVAANIHAKVRDLTFHHLPDIDGDVAFPPALQGVEVQSAQLLPVVK